MAIDEESALSTSTLEELSAGLAAAAAANAERLLPSGADKEMKKLSESVQQIAPSLKDAKAKQMKELEDIVSDIINILQLFLPKGAIDHISRNRRANPKTTMELKDIRARLNRILKKPHFVSVQPGTEPGITKMAVTHSPLETLVLSGKNDPEDQEKMIRLLLSVKETRQAGPCVIPIDRKRVTGTTEFARAIFDDKRVVKHFGRRIWIDASEIIDSGKLSKLIDKPASSMFWVHKTLGENLEEEQVLLVLDDLKNNKNVKYKTRWIRADDRGKINGISNRGTEGRRRIVLNPVHCSAIEVSLSSRVERLSAEDSWIMFEKCVFTRRDIRERPQLEAIGKNIVKKLEGSCPLIRSIGRILASSLDPSQWKLVLESRVWDLPVEEEFSQPALADACYQPRCHPKRRSHW